MNELDKNIEDNNVYSDEDLKKAMDNFFVNFETEDVQLISKNISSDDSESDISKFVIETYRYILNRDPDIDGLSHYTNMIKHGAINGDKLLDILKNSDEYKKLQKIDIPQENISIEFINCNTNNKKVDIDNEIQKIKDNNQLLNEKSSGKIVYCMMGTNRLHEIKPYLEQALFYVDKLIFIDGDSEDNTVRYVNSLNSLKGYEGKVHVKVFPWQDKFSAQRNNYLNKLKEMNYKGWVLVSDTDEHFTNETLHELRNIIKKAEKEGYNGVKFQVEDVVIQNIDGNGEVSSNINQYWKGLLFRFYPNIKYEGEPHETLVGVHYNWMKTNFTYTHTRSQRKVLSRAVENFFISNSNRYSEKWADFRFLCTKNGLLTFKDFFIKFEKCELPKEIENWIKEHKDINEDSGDSEIREMYKLYYEVLQSDKFNGNKLETSEPSDTLITSEIPIIYCMMGLDRLHEIRPYIEFVLPYINKFIFIDGGSTDGSYEYLESLKNTDMGRHKIEVYTYKWSDDFAAQRNNYLEILRDKNYEGYVLCSDTDEHFQIETLKNLQNIIKSAEEESCNGIRFHVKDVLVEDNDNNVIISEHVNEYWKPLLFKFNPQIRYEGSPHENMIGSISEPLKWINTNYIYEHIRSNKKICENGVRNFFISNSGRRSIKWTEFRKICSKYNIILSHDFITLLKNTKLPDELVNWITEHKDDNENIDDREIKQTYDLYNLYALHILYSNEKHEDINENIEIPDKKYNKNLFHIYDEDCESCGEFKKLSKCYINHNMSINMCKECWISLANAILEHSKNMW